MNCVPFPVGSLLIICAKILSNSDTPNLFCQLYKIANQRNYELPFSGSLKLTNALALVHSRQSTSPASNHPKILME